ncbi:hypothetical protein DM860_015508 [Cuscuta australis]|uniref:SANT domain-containing protein n=1 Tax=Cuscuta australis TaxID=267555 RepID=A0A328DH61_9ASTE|nr:hypothetical protein DM860_015508 [Cuscuta australis]
MDAINKSSEFYPSEQSSGSNYIFEDPELFPRVGAEYQAEIPLLRDKCGYRQLGSESSYNISIKLDISNSYPMGLPIPVMWIYDKKEDKIGEPKEGSDNNVVASNGDGSLRSEGSCSLVPGLPNEDWSGLECSSFLLGLYIFGKNLSLISRFIGSKKIGDILPFYYGKFYRSRDYRRWSGCRKIKGRRCIYGERIFMGWRQQELMSRLSSHVSEDSYHMLTEISKLFGDGKMTLEEYVFDLKDKAGITNLIEAVALGKGKKDLTGTALESTKTNHSLHVRAEVPVGKACSSLTSSEIVKILTGDFRLSKARSNDLFWEAVWPRLLARGWHSEQPSDVVYAGAKQSLVFLVSGVKKFSRRLEKGTHFFDSVTDVLNRVASAPSLLELDENAVTGGSLNEKKSSTDSEVGEDPELSVNPRRHSYLQPRSSAHKQHPMTFTVVDTSLYTGEGKVRIREVRSFPLVPLPPCGPLSVESSSDSVEGDEIEPYCVPNDKHLAFFNTQLKEVSTINTQLSSDPCPKKIKEEESSSGNNVCKVTPSRRLSLNMQSSEGMMKPNEVPNLASISEHTPTSSTNYKELSHNTQSTVINGLMTEGGSSFQDTCQILSGGERNGIENNNGSGQSVENSCPSHLQSEVQESTSITTVKQPVVTSRRQSTRSRPSAKVLEAFAYGFLGTSNKRKGSDNSTSTASRRIRRMNTNLIPLQNVAVDNESSVCHEEEN